MLAPIVLFVYNRVDHVVKTLTALSQNDLAPESELIIYSDGPKASKDEEAVLQVRSFVKSFKEKDCFKSLTIVEAEKNKGLANSIISGVTEIISKYEKIIVIEDDCITSNDFIEYMNNALDHYADNKKIWSIGGFTVDLNFPSDYAYDTYIMGRTCSYAWGTWIDRWNLVDWNVSDYRKFKYNLRARAKFNKYGNDRSKMLDLQQCKKTNSWAIRFCYAMYKNDMYTVYPCYSKVKNIGYDIGTHNSGKETRFNVKIKEQKITRFVDEVVVDERLRKQYIKYFKMSFIKRFLAYILNVLLPQKRRS